MTTVEELGFSTPEIANATGLSYRQIDHWRRVGVIEPSLKIGRGQGSPHIWSVLDLAILRVLKDLIALVRSQTNGTTTIFLREVAQVLQEWDLEDRKATLVVTPEHAELTSGPVPMGPHICVPLALYGPES